MVINKRHRRHISLAKRVAHNSNFEDYRHGAVLARGKKVINVSANKNSYKSWGSGFVIGTVDTLPTTQNSVASWVWIGPSLRVQLFM